MPRDISSRDYRSRDSIRGIPFGQGRRSGRFRLAGFQEDYYTVIEKLTWNV